MDRDASNTESQPNDHSTYNEEDNMESRRAVRLRGRLWGG